MNERADAVEPATRGHRIRLSVYANILAVNNAANPEAIRPLWMEEKEIIERAIALCDGNVVEAAKRLGISDSTIYRKRSKWSAPNK